MKAALLERLTAISKALECSGRAQAMIGLGSAGQEIDRLDAYSDLDFFVVADPGEKQALIENLAWLEKVAPVAYRFRNTADGYKLLFDDGIFCEFAVFEPDELRKADFSPGRVVWKSDRFDDALATPRSLPVQAVPESVDWLIGEALTNLYVGMCRYQRGEKLSALRFIQGYAVDRLIQLAEQIYEPAAGHRDPFSAERRFEQRFPQAAAEFTSFMPGYHDSPRAALKILRFIDERYGVNARLKQVIQDLCADGESGGE